MASQTVSNHPSVNRDAIPIHKLLLSVGQLKFSLNALMTVQVQNACISLQESKPYNSKAFTGDSNKILENVLNEVVSTRATTNGCKNYRSNESAMESSSLLSVQELSIAHELLKSELQKVREKYYGTLSSL